MPHSSPYLPGAVFSGEEGGQGSVPRVLIAPYRYIQGDGILDQLGRYLSIIPSANAGVLISAGGQRRFGPRLLRSFAEAGVASVFVTFEGECSVEEVERAAAFLRSRSAPIDCLIAVGGGKCVDAGKCVAHRLGVPVVICPTLVSNDAPCSALSVIYSTGGVWEGVEFFPVSPALVAVDTRIVAAAPERYLVAGMGDAMATWYEARTCFNNPKARSTVGARPTLTARAIGELCSKTLFEYGARAIDAVKRAEVNEAVECVVEANTLLSGIGFESGGLAVAHSIAQALTVVPVVHRNYLHGEMVAIGVLSQLVLESSIDEAVKVAEFFAGVGLPVHLGQVSLSPEHTAELGEVMAAAMLNPFVHNEPFEVNPGILIAASKQAHELGLDVARSAGDAAYRALHGH